MAGPYAESSIVLDVETGDPEQFLQFDPDRPRGDQWLHRLEEFDRSATVEDVVDRYALPESSEYQVAVVTVPADERLRIGDVAGTDDRAGGGDLVELLDRERVPDDWVDRRTALQAFLD